MANRGFGLAVLFGFILAQVSFAADIPASVPKGPDAQFTVGSTCQHATRIRFDQKIKYCTRNVDRSTKDEVFARYDEKYHFKQNGLSRPQFKIDHFIPLCLGGSNEVDNLWPQHLSISLITDSIENLLCMHLQKNLMKQDDAIETIKRVKFNLAEAPNLQAQLEKDLLQK